MGKITEKTIKQYTIVLEDHAPRREFVLFDDEFRELQTAINLHFARSGVHPSKSDDFNSLSKKV